MKNNKLKLVLKIVCRVLCVALILTGSVVITSCASQDDIDALQTKLDGASGEIADLKEKYAAALQELDALRGDQVQTKTELDELREKVKPWAIQDEDVLSYALFEQVAVKFFESRKAKMYGLDSKNADFENKVHNV